MGNDEVTLSTKLHKTTVVKVDHGDNCVRQSSYFLKGLSFFIFPLQFIITDKVKGRRGGGKVSVL